MFGVWALFFVAELSVSSKLSKRQGWSQLLFLPARLIPSSLFFLPTIDFLVVANMEHNNMENMAEKNEHYNAQESSAYGAAKLGEVAQDGRNYGADEEHGQNALHRDLKGRHMQMIAMYVSQ